MSKSYFYIFLLSTFFQCTLFMHSHNFTLIIHVLMKKREPAVMTVALQSLNITYSVIEEFKLFVVLLFNCFFLEGQVTLYNER